MGKQRNPNPKIVTPKGERYPGSGRKVGTPNKVSVDARVLVSELVADADYQAKLRRDFTKRRVHPTIENMVWAYSLGKPNQNINVTAAIDVTARLETERRAFAALDVADLERLAAESQALVDKALTLARHRSIALTAPDIVVEADLPIVSAETLGNMAGSDNGSSVTQTEQPAETPTTPTNSDT